MGTLFIKFQATLGTQTVTFLIRRKTYFDLILVMVTDSRLVIRDIFSVIFSFLALFSLAAKSNFPSLLFQGHTPTLGFLKTLSVFFKLFLFIRFELSLLGSVCLSNTGRRALFSPEGHNQIKSSHFSFELHFLLSFYCVLQIFSFL